MEELRRRAEVEGGSAVLQGVQSLEGDLTSTDSEARSSAVSAIATLTEAWAHGVAPPDTSHASSLATFLASRIVDLPCASSALNAASAILHLSSIPLTSVSELAQSALSLDAAALPADTRAARLRTLELAQRRFHEVGNPGDSTEWHISSEVLASSGKERDPRAALALIRLACVCSHFSESLFDGISQYFPASVSGGSSRAVERTSLATSLECALARLPRKAVSLASDELNERENVQDAMSLLVAASRTAMISDGEEASARAAVAVLARLTSDGIEPGAVHHLSSALSSTSTSGAVLAEAPKHMQHDNWQSRSRVAYAASLASPLAAEAFVIADGVGNSAEVVASLARGAADACDADEGPTPTAFDACFKQVDANALLVSATYNQPQDAGADGIASLVRLHLADEESCSALAYAAAEGNQTALDALEQCRVARTLASYLCSLVVSGRPPIQASSVTDALRKCTSFGGEDAREKVVARFLWHLMEMKAPIDDDAHMHSKAELDLIRVALLNASKEGQINERILSEQGLDHQRLCDCVRSCVDEDDALMAKCVARLLPVQLQERLLDILSKHSRAGLQAVAGAAPGAHREEHFEQSQSMLTEAASRSEKADLYAELAEAGAEILNCYRGKVEDQLGPAELATVPWSGKVPPLAWTHAALARRTGTTSELLDKLLNYLWSYPQLASAGIAGAIDPSVLGGLLPNKAVLLEQRLVIPIAKRLSLAGGGKLDPTASRYALLRVLASCSDEIAQHVITTTCSPDFAPAIDASLELASDSALIARGAKLLEDVVCFKSEENQQQFPNGYKHSRENSTHFADTYAGQLVATVGRALHKAQSMAAREAFARTLGKLADTSDASVHKQAAVRALRKGLDDKKRRVRRECATALEKWR